jgi:cell division septation protein DedD
MARRISLAIVLSSALVLAGCGELQDWRSTQRADTLEAYESFVERYPQSQYVPVAQRRRADLVEQRDWLIATESDSAEGYRAFINNHPKGRWTREARVRLQNFLSTPGVLGPAAVEPLESPPPPAMLPAEPEQEPEAAVDPEAAPAPVTHRIQLGAYSSREKALEAWRTARAQHIELQGLVSQVVAGRNGQGEVFRLQASVVSEERAREVCRVLVAAGQGCVYVLPGR